MKKGLVLSNVEGFTLIEVLVSVGILAILSVFIINSLIATVRSNTKIELMKDIKQNGDYAVSTITRYIQNAKTVDCAGGGLTKYSINITNSDTSQIIISSIPTVTPSGISYQLQITNIPLAAPQTLQSLTSTDITLNCGTNLCLNGFNCSQQIGSQKITFGFVLKHIDQPYLNVSEQAAQKFQTTVEPRN